MPNTIHNAPTQPRSSYRTRSGIQLLVPFGQHDTKAWAHPTDYSRTHALANLARTLNTGAIRAPSARLEGGVNIAVLDPAALSPNVRPHSSWAFLVTRDGLLAIRELSDQTMRFKTPEF